MLGPDGVDGGFILVPTTHSRLQEYVKSYEAWNQSRLTLTSIKIPVQWLDMIHAPTAHMKVRTYTEELTHRERETSTKIPLNWLDIMHAPTAHMKVNTHPLTSVHTCRTCASASSSQSTCFDLSLDTRLLLRVECIFMSCVCQRLCSAVSNDSKKGLKDNTLALCESCHDTIIAVHCEACRLPITGTLREREKERECVSMCESELSRRHHSEREKQRRKQEREHMCEI